MKKLLILALLAHFCGVFLIAQENFEIGNDTFTIESTHQLSLATDVEEDIFAAEFGDMSSDANLGVMETIKPEEKSKFIALMAYLYSMHIKPTVENIVKFFQLRNNQ